MEDLLLNVKALAAMKSMSISDLAKEADIDPERLQNISIGRTKMSARDLISLAKATGVNPFNIKVD